MHPYNVQPFPALILLLQGPGGAPIISGINFETEGAAA